MLSIRLMLISIALATAPSAPARASQTLCHFHVTDGSPRYAFQFIGYGDIAMIQVDAPEGLVASRHHVIALDARTSTIHLVHTSAGGEGRLPSFTLRGTGSDVRMEVDGHALVGEFGCGT